MGYFIVKDIESTSSYLKRQWHMFAFKELLDNAYDWLNDHYPAANSEDKAVRKIIASMWLTGVEDNQFIHVAIRNSNVDNIPAFTNLAKTLDYDLWYSTKRGQHRMTTGGLGDALKRILGMGYAAWREAEIKTKQQAGEEVLEFELEEKQWIEPIIVRCNGMERRCFVKVEMSKGNRWVEIQKEPRPTRHIGIDTEVEITLPTEQWIGGLQINELTRYYGLYRVPKSRTIFELQEGCERKNDAG